jgi:RNA polymerase sigma factor (sigma-70 family)
MSGHSGVGEGSAALPDGLDDIVDSCTPLVTRICRSRLRGLPLADIEDAIQETFLQLAQANRDRIDNIEAWLIAVALRVCARTLRNRYRNREVLASQLPGLGAEGHAFQSADERLWMAQFASLLPSVDRRLLHMLYVQDLSYGDVANYFHITNGHARVLAYRARQHARWLIDSM